MNTKAMSNNAKYVTPSSSPALTSDALQTLFPELTFIGQLGRTGVVGVNQKTGDLEVCVRHPNWVPTAQPNGSIEYGGVQSQDYITFLLGRTFGEKAKGIAQDVLNAVREGRTVPYGALRLGKETEAIAVSELDGSIVALPAAEQVEFQRGVLEDAMPPYATIQETILARAKHIIKRAQEHPGMLILDLSAPLTGSPKDIGMKLNAGKGAIYILPWATKTQCHVVTNDLQATQTINAIAQISGYSDLDGLIADQGYQAIWPMMASQISYGMPHITSPQGTNTVPLELLIATADIFNSNLGGLAEILMASSPAVFGITPKIIDQHNAKTTVLRPRDYRMVLRYSFETAWPGEPIGSIPEIMQRWTVGTLTGLMYTVDRLSYRTQLAGRPVTAVLYSGSRVRVETNDLSVQSGRVESTVSGSSPSLLDEIARDSLLYLLAIAAFEAVAHEQQPSEYFYNDYPNIKGWHERKDLAHLFNLYGASEPRVSNLIAECIQLMDHLYRGYPALHSMIQFTKWRISNLSIKAAHTANAYARSPSGPISEMIMSMLADGHTPLDISVQLRDYQLSLAHRILTLDQSEDLFELLRAT